MAAGLLHASVMFRSIVILALVAGCPEHADPIEPQVTSSVIRKQIPISINRKIDVVFVIDNAPAMAPLLDNVRTNLGRFISMLRQSPGGVPELRLGVVTTTGEGVLRGTFGLDGNFVIDVIGPDGERTRNYEGDLAAVFERLTDVGASGGTSEPLTAIRRVFEHPVNQGFLRTNAYTGVFVVSATDDRGELVAATEQLLKQLNSDPSRVIVGGALGDTPQIAALLDRFPNRSTRASITDPDWAAQVFSLMTRWYRTSLGAPCIEGPLFDLDLAAPGLQPACSVAFEFPIGGEVVRPCTAGINGRCWEIFEDRARCPGELDGYFSIRQPRIDVPDPTMLVIECLLRPEEQRTTFDQP